MRKILLFVVCCLFFVFSVVSNAEDLAPKRTVFWGVFREGAPANMGHIENVVKQTGKKPACIMWYQDWDQNFPRDAALNVIEYGAIPQIVWEPWSWNDHSKIQLKDIISGKWDSYIKTWAQEIRAFKHPVMLRFAHEFNIEGYPWGLVNSGKDPEVYKSAFRHVVDIFKREKADNVRWIWCYMNFSYPKEAWNDWVAAYPGDAYVDWIGIDGYNWGTTQSWSEWQSFKFLFGDQARLSRKLWPNKPIMIAEFAAAEKGGDKAAWISEIPDYLKSSMRDIDMIIWFDLRKETDWRINSSKSALAAISTMLKDPIFSSNGSLLAGYSYKVSPIKLASKITYAAKAGSGVKIDGSLSDWTKTYPISMKDISFFKEGYGWNGPRDLSGIAYLMWDSENLYLAAEITDHIPMVNKNLKQNIWDGDCIEMVLGFDPSANKDRDSFGRGDYQLGFGTGDGKGREAAIWSWQRNRTPSGSEIKVKKTNDPEGYVLEAKVPWAFFRGVDVPSSGSKLGFDIAFDDADATQEREKQFIWNGDYMFYRDPSVWGSLVLK